MPIGVVDTERPRQGHVSCFDNGRHSYGGNSGGAAFVSTVQSADFGYRNDASLVVALYGSSFGWVFGERKVGAAPMVMFDEDLEPAAEVLFAKDDHMIEAFPPKSTNYVRTLPGSSRRRQHLPNPKGFDPFN